MEGYFAYSHQPIAQEIDYTVDRHYSYFGGNRVYGDKELDALLILSQVILSLQLGFAIIPLIHFVSDKKTMGVFAIKPIVKIFAWCIAAVLVYLNKDGLGAGYTRLFIGRIPLVKNTDTGRRIVLFSLAAVYQFAPTVI